MEPRNQKQIPDDIAEEYASRVKLAMLRGNKELAVSVVHRAFAESDGARGVTIDDSVFALFSEKTSGRLEGAGLMTIRDVLGQTREQLLGIDQIGETTVRVMLAQIKELLVRLKPEHNEDDDERNE